MNALVSWENPMAPRVQEDRNLDGVSSHEEDWDVIELIYCEVVEYDLRSPSALHGKKGFDRLVYACKNALNASTTWLFCNLSKSIHSSYISNQQSGY